MNINLYPFLYLWLVLDVVVIVLFGLRQKVARAESTTMSMSLTDPAAASQMKVLETKLNQFDKWAKLLCILAVVLGALLGVLAIIQAFTSTAVAG